jgi:membrane protein implicated in regulation of membrane protease activity
MKFRLIWAIISVILEEIAIVVIALLVLPQFEIKISTVVLILIMVGWFIMSAFLYVAGVDALNRKPFDGPETIIGKKGIVVKALNPKGLVKINGELWGAESAENIEIGEEVVITGRSGIKLVVEHCSDRNHGEST